MLKPSELELLADKIAKKLHRLNDEVLSVAEVARMLDKTEGAVKKMCYRGSCHTVNSRSHITSARKR